MDRNSPSSPSPIDFVLRALAVVIGVAVVALSLGPQADSDGVVSDKIVHFLSYLSFTYCALLGFIGRPGRAPSVFRLAYVLVGMMVAAGAAIELLQILVRRESSLLDALANAAGASLGLALWLLTMRRGPQQA